MINWRKINVFLFYEIFLATEDSDPLALNDQFLEFDSIELSQKFGSVDERKTVKELKKDLQKRVLLVLV